MVSVTSSYFTIDVGMFVGVTVDKIMNFATLLLGGNMGLFSFLAHFKRSKTTAGAKRKLSSVITEADKQWVDVMLTRIVNIEDSAKVYFRMNPTEFVVSCDLASEYGRRAECFGVLSDVSVKKWEALWRYIRERVRTTSIEKKEGEFRRSMCVYVDPETTRGEYCYMTKDRPFYVNVFLHVIKPRLFKDSDDSSCCGCHCC